MRTIYKDSGTIKKSIAASLAIGLGCIVLLKAPLVLGAILFAFGLLTVCIRKLNLFTGMCGYARILQGKDLKDYIILLTKVLVINIISSWIIGYTAAVGAPGLKELAQTKISTWSNNVLEILIPAFFCGVIMYIAVDMYRKDKSVLGILLGVPLFLYSGFHHCIANATYLGMSGSFDYRLIIMVLGNLIGSLFIAWLTYNKVKETKQEENDFTEE